MVGLYAIIALGILGVSLKSYWGVHQATAVHELEPVAMGLSEWQQAPWKKDSVAVKGVASADAALPVPSGVTVPPDAEGFPTSDYSVALTKSAQGHVMILVPRNLDIASDSYGITGIVEPTAALGLPATFLATLKQRSTDLDTGHVMCLYWRWKGAGYAGSPFTGAYIGFLMAPFIGGLAAIMTLIFVPKFARRRRHAAWALRQVALAHA